MVPLASLCGGMELLRREGYDLASLSGGEALLYPEIRLLVARLKALGYRINLVSNGSTLSLAFSDVIGDIDLVAVSFDGDEQLHNEIRGSQRAFSLAMRGLEYVRACGKTAAIAFCVTRRSLRDIPAIVDIALAHGVATLHLRPLVLTGRAKNLMTGDGLDETQMNRLFVLTLALRQEVGHRLAIHLDLVHAKWANAHRDQYRSLLESDDARAIPLSDLVNPMVITADGFVRPLTYGFDPRFDVGRVSEVSASTIEQYKASRIGDLRSHMADALERAASEDRLIDWFAFCTEDRSFGVTNASPRH